MRAARTTVCVAEWLYAGEKLISEDPEREDIRPEVDGVSADLLRRHFRNEAEEAMKGYMELVNGGHREIFRIE
jgi:hypothetical protein